MNLHNLERRHAFLGAAGLVASQTLSSIQVNAQGLAPKGFVFGPTEGEHLIQRGGHIFIKADPTTGSNSIAMGTQQILRGVGIPIHRHFEMDEAFYVVDGGGTFLLEEQRLSIERGARRGIVMLTYVGQAKAASGFVVPIT